jgi:hypothetical protein
MQIAAMNDGTKNEYDFSKAERDWFFRLDVELVPPSQQKPAAALLPKGNINDTK